MPAKKAKAKEWVDIIAPPYFGATDLGKTLAVEPEKVVGRRITLSALDVSENVNKFYLKVFFRIVKLEGNKALTEFDGSECLRDYISRMVLRRVRRIDTVQDLQTKDGKMIRVKGLAVISRRAKRNVQIAVKNRIMEMLKSLVESSTLEQFVEDIFTDEIKSRILQEVRVIYPVRNFEIRKTEMVR